MIEKKLSNATPLDDENVVLRRSDNNFLNKTQITNCILEAPNGVAEWSGVSPTGSLVNNQGVVSGFSASNYLTINKIPETVNSFEMEFCITTGNTTPSDIDQCITGQPDNYTSPQFQIPHATNKLEFLCGSSSSAWGQVIRATNTVNLNTTYWLRALWDGATIYFYLKTSKEAAWELQGTTQQSYVEWSEVMLLGIDNHVNSLNKPFKGSIDLSQSYIKINGEIFWQGNDLGFNQFRVKQGLKTLIPNGRNEDRTLNNIEKTVTQDSIQTIPTGYTNSYWAAVGENATRLAKYAWEYNEDKNYITGIDATTIGQKSFTTMIGEMEVKNGNIVSFTPYNPVSLATKDEIEDIKKEYGTAYIIETYHNEFSDAQEGGANWYRIWSDGFIEQGGYVAPNATRITVAFLVPYKHNNTINVQVSESMLNHINSDTGGYQDQCAAQNITVNNFYVSCQNRIFNWRACGY